MKQLYQIRKRQCEYAESHPNESAESDFEVMEIRMAADMLADLREVAAQLGFRNTQELIKAYVGAGLERDKSLIHKQHVEG